MGPGSSSLNSSHGCCNARPACQRTPHLGEGTWGVWAVPSSQSPRRDWGVWLCPHPCVTCAVLFPALSCTPAPRRPSAPVQLVTCTFLLSHLGRPQPSSCSCALLIHLALS